MLLMTSCRRWFVVPGEDGEGDDDEMKKMENVGPPPQPWLPFVHSDVIVDFSKKTANNQGCYRRFQRLEECLMEAPIRFDDGEKKRRRLGIFVKERGREEEVYIW
ncbi:hypothetical protein L1887_17508 [Cichorium endivia]|nr:hypothetical protein L1887_17508 [Cichorium endivia]